MKKNFLLLLFLFSCFNFTLGGEMHLTCPDDDFIRLLNSRKSIRNFTGNQITKKQISYIMYSAGGITSRGNRTAPSAGALYPLMIYIYAKNVESLKKGLYFYNPYKNSLVTTKEGDFTETLTGACLNQQSVRNASLSIIIVYDKQRMEHKYRNRSLKYACLEAGHISQNILLAVTKLNLGAVPIGAFRDAEILSLLSLDTSKCEVLYVNSIGIKNN